MSAKTKLYYLLCLLFSDNNLLLSGMVYQKSSKQSKLNSCHKLLQFGLLIENGNLTLNLLPLRLYFQMFELLFFLDLQDGKYDFELSNVENISGSLAGTIADKTTNKQKWDSQN